MNSPPESETCFNHQHSSIGQNLHSFQSLLQVHRQNPNQQIVFGQAVNLPCFPRQTEGLFHELAPKGTQSMIVKQHGVHLFVVAAACTTKHLVLHRIKLTRNLPDSTPGESVPINEAIVHSEAYAHRDPGPEILKIQPVSLITYKGSGGILRLEPLRETQGSLYFAALKEGGLIEVWHLRAGALRPLHRYQGRLKANITFMQAGCHPHSSTDLLVTKQKNLHWVSLAKRKIQECQLDWKLFGTSCDKFLEGIDKFCWFPDKRHLLLVGARSCLVSGYTADLTGIPADSAYESHNWQPLVLQKELSPGISRLKVFNIYTHRARVCFQTSDDRVFENLELNLFLLVSGLSLRVALFAATADKPPSEFMFNLNFAKLDASGARSTNMFESLSLEDASILFFEPEFVLRDKTYSRGMFVLLVHAGQLTVYQTELNIDLSGNPSVVVKDCVPVRVFSGFEVQANILHKTIQVGVLEVGDQKKCRNRKWIVAGSGRSNDLVLIPIYF